MPEIFYVILSSIQIGLVAFLIIRENSTKQAYEAQVKELKTIIEKNNTIMDKLCNVLGVGKTW